LATASSCAPRSKSTGVGFGLGGIGSIDSSIGDKSIFNQTSLWSNADDGSLSTILVPPAAFSEASLAFGSKQGLIDDEAHRILLRMGHDADRVKVYDRGLPHLMLRSAQLSTSVKVPPLDAIAPSEIHFGPQRVRAKLSLHVLNTYLLYDMQTFHRVHGIA